MTEQRTVYIAELDADHLIASIRLAIAHYRKTYGEPKRIWINTKDIADDIVEVDGFRIERRGGCAKAKLMVM